MPGSCGFPLTNPHFAESVDVVPESNLLNQLILLYICLGNTQPALPVFLQQIAISGGGLDFVRSFITGFQGGI